MYSKFTGEHPCRSVISIKLPGTSAWVFSCKFDAYIQNSFSSEHLWRAASGYTTSPMVLTTTLDLHKILSKKKSQIPLCRSIALHKPSSIRRFFLYGPSMLLQYKQILNSENRCSSSLVFSIFCKGSSPNFALILSALTFVSYEITNREYLV